jgi:FlaA1/EpsC-like NDP-sugar epimerase
MIVLSLTARAATRNLIPRLCPPERVLLVGAGPSAQMLIRKIRAHGPGRLEVAGFLSDADELHDPPRRTFRASENRETSRCSVVAIASSGS